VDKLKNILYLAGIILFLATTFQSNIPPGWFQQVRPVNDPINDIFFLDSLNGWAVTNGSFNTNDTAYIFKTTNGGGNWLINFSSVEKLNVVQFINESTGYVGGGSNGSAMLSFLKTTNAGMNWHRLNAPDGVYINDMFFLNSDTGWISDNNLLTGGIYYTITGGLNWQLQIGSSYKPTKLFFLNKDTGWAIIQDRNLFRTTNSGINWILQASFDINNPINSIFFINKNTGWLANTSSSSLNGIYKTVNGGQNWVSQVDPTPTGSGINDIFFIDSLKGWAACGFAKILHTTNGGENWFVQTTPTAGYTKIQFIDSNKGWSAGSQIVHTTDGGGLSDIEQIGSEMPSKYELFQNYPNPFNPSTKIRFSIKSQRSNVKIIIYDIAGKLISELVSQNFSSGTYEVQFIARDLSSGIYYYTLITDNFTQTKKMLLIK
jgi:photosystem II stability/assembly factor-like uncharacterized protein